MGFYDYLTTKTNQKTPGWGRRDWESARPQADFFRRCPPSKPKKTLAIRPGGPMAGVALSPAAVPRDSAAVWPKCDTEATVGELGD